MRLSHLTSRSLASSFKVCVVFSCFQPRQGRQMLAQGEAQPKASETLGRLSGSMLVSCVVPGLR